MGYDYYSLRNGIIFTINILLYLRDKILEYAFAD